MPSLPELKFATFVRLAALCVLLCKPAFAQESHLPQADDACHKKYLEHSQTFGDYTFKAYSNEEEGEGCLQIFQGPRLLLRRTQDLHYNLGKGPDQEDPPVPLGTDLTGSGHPEIIVAGYSGGAHCCTTLLLFQLQPNLRLLTQVDLGDYGTILFDKDSTDGKYYLRDYDEVFVYWNSSFAGSAAPKILLRWVPNAHGGGSYRIALDKMHAPPPTPKEWEENFLSPARKAFAPGEADETSEGKQYLVGSGLWKGMLNLIDSGHSPFAWKLVDQAWPPAKPDKTQFLTDFCSRLKESPYWPDLKPTIRQAPPACAEAFRRKAPPAKATVPQP